jgi:hypothetical protein
MEEKWLEEDNHLKDRWMEKDFNTNCLGQMEILYNSASHPSRGLV